MNEVFQRRLIGLAVLLLLVFLLSLLLPGDDVPEDGEPSATVSLTEPFGLPESEAATSPYAPEPASVDRPKQPTAEVAISDVEQSFTAEKPAPASPPVSAPPASTPSPAAAPPARLKLDQNVVASPKKAPAPASVVATPKPKEPAAVIAPKPKLAESVAKQPAVPPKPASKASAPGWYVQIGSYSDAGSAATVASLLRKVGYRIEVSTITGSKGTPLNRVRAGSYPTEAAARAAYERVAKQGYPQARVVQEPGR